MTLSSDQTVAAELESIIRAVPGVTGLFRTGGVVAKIVDLGAQALGLRGDDSPLVAVDRWTLGISVEVAIGVDAAADGVDVVTRVHGAVEARLVELGAPPAEIRITIVNVDEPARDTAHGNGS